MDDVKSLFFPTEISTRIRRPMTQQVRANQRNLQCSDQPFDRLRRTKNEMKQMKKKYFKTLSTNHKLELSVNKLQRKKQLTRAQFLKLYGFCKIKKQIKKYKIKHLDNNEKIQLRKKKLQYDLQKILTKNQEEDKIASLQKDNKKQKKKFIELKYVKDNQISTRARKQHDLIKNHHTQFMIRKSHISSALQERSKHNYFNKVNKQLSMLRDYQSVISDINGLKLSKVGKFIQNEEQIDKNYQSFFMTTKNTIS